MASGELRFGIESRSMNQRWAIFALGMWMAGTILIAVVATQNFRTIDRLLATSPNAEFRAAVDRLGHDRGRDLLRYLSSELNRLYFRLWNFAQLPLGFAALGLVIGARAGRSIRWSVGGMVAIVLIALVWLTPQIVSLGRSLDFVPREVPPPGMSRFWILHGTYLGLELVKLVLGGVATVGLVRQPTSSQDIRR